MESSAGKGDYAFAGCLQTFTVGYDQMAQGQFLAAIPLAERAIVLDPNFAMAYMLLAGAFQNAGDLGRQREYIDKAFALIDRVSRLSETSSRATTTTSMASWTKRLTHIGWVARTIPAFGCSLTI